MQTNLIPVERLTLGTLIRVAGTNDAARVLDITFDGYGYGIDLRYGQFDDGYEEYMYVEAGGSVEFEGVGEPKLKPATLDDVTALVCGRILSTAGVDAAAHSIAAE